VLPRLTRLEPLEAQCAAAGGIGPDAFNFDGRWSGPVYVRLGRAPRAEVEATLDSLAPVGFSEQDVARFTESIRRRLDAIYPE
jgi:hypothetical protein